MFLDSFGLVQLFEKCFYIYLINRQNVKFLQIDGCKSTQTNFATLYAPRKGDLEDELAARIDLQDSPSCSTEVKQDHQDETDKRLSEEDVHQSAISSCDPTSLLLSMDNNIIKSDLLTDDFKMLREKGRARGDVNTTNSVIPLQTRKLINDDDEKIENDLIFQQDCLLNFISLDDRIVQNGDYNDDFHFLSQDVFYNLNMKSFAPEKIEEKEEQKEKLKVEQKEEQKVNQKKGRKEKVVPPENTGANYRASGGREIRPNEEYMGTGTASNMSVGSLKWDDFDEAGDGHIHEANEDIDLNEMISLLHEMIYQVKVDTEDKRYVILRACFECKKCKKLILRKCELIKILMHKNENLKNDVLIAKFEKGNTLEMLLIK